MSNYKKHPRNKEAKTVNEILLEKISIFIAVFTDTWKYKRFCEIRTNLGELAFYNSLEVLSINFNI